MHLNRLIVVSLLYMTCNVNWVFGQARTQDEVNFENFKKQFRRNYTNAENTLRFNIYRNNELQMEKHNSRFNMGLVTYKIGINKYSDRLNAEFTKRMLGFRRMRSGVNMTLFNAFQSQNPNNNLGALPVSVDWRTKGWVSPVKDQGWCGSCYAFTSCGAIEGAYAKKYKKLIDCSEQNLVDCTHDSTSSYKNLGCDGGEMWRCFQYVKDNKGLEAEESYNYLEEYSGSCQYAAADKKFSITGYTFVANTEAALQAAVAIQPIAVALDASPTTFQYYSSGIYYEPTCSSTNINHAVLLVGYGKDASGRAFWLIKNSWGTTWGEGGYMRLARNRNNHCGIANDSNCYPTIA